VTEQTVTTDMNFTKVIQMKTGTVVYDDDDDDDIFANCNWVDTRWQ
jgi:hypothetical protein